jgi:hypothetical protein
MFISSDWRSCLKEPAIIVGITGFPSQIEGGKMFLWD